MIELLFTIMWLTAGLITFRRVGYVLETSAHNGHDLQEICDRCRCKNCDENHGRHYKYRVLSHGRACHNFEFSFHSVHERTMLAFLPAVAAWPLPLLAFIAYAIAVKAGITKPSVDFFAPPPRIESKEQRKERTTAEREERIKELENANASLERDLARLGIEA